MNNKGFLITAIGVLSIVGLIGWISGEYLWAIKIVTIAGFGFLVSAVITDRKESPDNPRRQNI